MALLAKHPAKVKTLKVLILAAVSLMLMTGCGSSDQTPQLSAAAAGRMHREVQSVRAAVAAGDRARSFTALKGLAATANHQARAGNITSEDLADISDQIAVARDQIDAQLPAPSAQPSPATPDGADTPGDTFGKKLEDLLRKGLGGKG